MKKGLIEVYCGTGKGKTSLAIGQSLKACASGKSVIIIQFLKGSEKSELDYLETADMDIKLFRFEKSSCYYDELSTQEQDEQRENIRNGLNYARKVIATHECDLLVLDEILGLPEHSIATWEEINEILHAKNNDMHIILTGRCLPDKLRGSVDEITKLETEILEEVCVDKECE